jgi:hypothetical protein
MAQRALDAHAMPKRSEYDRDAIAALFAQQTNVAAHAQLLGLGMPLSTITHRIAPHGPWQRILPGVVICHRGTPTRRELVVAATLYSGDRAVVTGMEALRAHGVRAAVKSSSTQVHTLIPNERRRQNHGFVLVERSRHLPEPVDIDGIPTAPIAKAVVDACRRLERLNLVRELVAEVVQSRKVAISEMRDAVAAAARQRTALSNLVLEEMSAGVRSVAEGRARDLILPLPIPQPEWNVRLHSTDGTFIAEPDGYWLELLAALEIDSMRWHLSPESYKRTQRRQRKLLTEAGVLVLPVAPSDIIESPKQFQQDVRNFVLQAQRRTPPSGLVVVRRRAA